MVKRKMMPIWILTFIFAVILLCLRGYGQSYPAGYASRIKPVTILPATCSVAAGDVVNYTTGGVTTLMACGAANTWHPWALNSQNQLIVSQGILTGSLPWLNDSATWNNGAVTFVNKFVNITDGASAAASMLLEFQVGGVDKFVIRKDGQVSIPLTTGYKFIAGTSMKASVDGLVNWVNDAGTGLTRITLGLETVAFTSIFANNAVGGQTQGIILLRGDGTTQVQANLGAATNGSMIYCSDCTIANPCAGGGTGSIAKRLNGVWVCN